MATHAHPATPPQISDRAGTAALILGALFLASTVLTFVLSLTGLLDWPNWARALGLAGLPVGFLGTPVAYALARQGPGRRRGLAGLAILAVALAAFVALQFAMG
ncbi:hypothetical protein [Ornithinimicrobium sp. W1665]|uniref:hypothetical protein n=1 Tax=Ornithinimicrobium sp. W1665 TaxID=3416666 RepID=UPI003CEF4366